MGTSVAASATGVDLGFWLAYFTNGKHLHWYASVQFTLFAAVARRRASRCSSASPPPPLRNVPVRARPPARRRLHQLGPRHSRRPVLPVLPARLRAAARADPRLAGLRPRTRSRSAPASGRPATRPTSTSTASATCCSPRSRSASSTAPSPPTSSTAPCARCPRASSRRPAPMASRAGRCCGASISARCGSTPCPASATVWMLLIKSTSLLSLLQIVDIVRRANRLGAPNFSRAAGLVHGDWRWAYYLVLLRLLHRPDLRLREGLRRPDPLGRPRHDPARRRTR